MTGRLAGAIRRWAPPLFGPLQQIRHSDAVHVARALPGLARFRARARGRPVVFDVCAPMGMGGMLTHAAKLYQLIDHQALDASVAFTNPLYAAAEGKDWLPDFFDRLTPAPRKGAMRIAVRNQLDYTMIAPTPPLELANASRLLWHHLRFNPAVEDAVAAAIAAVGPLDHTIGIHYRGTDKSREARVTSIDDMVDAIRYAARLTGTQRLLLLTDEAAVAAALRARCADFEVVSYGDVAPASGGSKPGVPVHFAPGDGTRKGMEAIVLMRLLARCRIIVRTASYLSGWAQILAPETPAFFVNPNGLFVRDFPDDRLLEQAVFAVTVAAGSDRAR